MGVWGADSNIVAVMTEEGHRIRPVSCPQNVIQFGAFQECGGSEGGASGTRRGADIRVAQHPSKKLTKCRGFEGREMRIGGEEDVRMLSLEARASGNESLDGLNRT